MSKDDDDDEIEEQADMLIKDNIPLYLNHCKSQNQRDATLAKKKWMLIPNAARWEKMGICMMSQITTKNTQACIETYSKEPSRTTGRPPGDTATLDLTIICKTYLCWAFKEGYVKSQKMRNQKNPRADDADINLDSDEDVSGMLAVIDAFWDPVQNPGVLRFRHTAADRNRCRLRVKVTYAMAVSTGLRRGEILNLCWESWDIDRNVIVVDKRAKGRRGREVNSNPQLTRLLRQWYAARYKVTIKAMDKATEDRLEWPNYKADDYIICSNEGGKLDGGACLHQLQRYAKWGRERGMRVPARVTLHGARHKAINDLLQINPEHARQMAGHRDLSTTQRRYGHTMTADVQVSHAKSDVLERIEANRQAVTLPVRSKKLF